MDKLKSNKKLIAENKELRKQLLDFEELKNEFLLLQSERNELKHLLDRKGEELNNLRNIETTLNLVGNNISDVIWILDLRGDFLYISPSATRIFGYTTEEFANIKIQDVLTKDSYLFHRNYIKNRLLEESGGNETGTISLKIQHVKKNGEIFWAEISSNPLRDNENKLIGIIGVTRDISDRLDTEDQLKKLSVAVEQSPASIVITDIEGNIQYVNSTFTAVTGYTSTEAIGKTPRILKSGKTPDHVYANLWKTITMGKIWKGEIINKKKSGEIYWERITIAPIRNEDEKLVNYVAVKEDISAYKKAEQKIKESQERYKLLSDLSVEGIVIQENDVILDVNDSFTKITGYSRDELVGGNSMLKFLTDESLKKLNQNQKDKFEHPYEVEAKKKDGTIFYAEIEARHFSYIKKEYSVIAIRDITYRKRIDNVLHSSLMMNKLLVTHTEEQIIAQGVEEAIKLTKSSIGFFHFIDENQNTISIQKWSIDTLKNCVVADEMRHMSLDKAGTWAESFHLKKPVIHNDYQSLSNKKGLPEGHYPIKRYISLPVMENEKVNIVIGVGNKESEYDQLDVDILSLFAETVWMVVQRKRAEKELIESNAIKDKFLSIISHDLRSPIGSIHSLTQMLSQTIETISQEDLSRFVTTINSTVGATYNLINNMLIWAQNHRTAIEFKPEDVKVSEVFDNAINIEKIEAEKKEIEIVKKIEKDLTVFADFNMLNTVIRNLFFNAIKFTPRGGRIVVGIAQYSEKMAIITIKDNGIGISKEKQELIFQEKQFISTKGTENEKGTGLGLILCKEFVEKNGGKIWLESERGKGSTFFFTVPINFQN